MSSIAPELRLQTSFSNNELDAFQAVGSFSSTLTLFASAFTLFRIYNDSRVGTLSLATKIVAVLLCINFFYAMSTIVGRAASRNRTFCSLNGFGIQAIGLTTQLWMMSMAWIMWRWIVKKKHPRRLERLIPRLFILSFVLAFGNAFLVLSFNMYGQTSQWCWITSDQAALRFYSFYVFLVMAWVWCIVFMLWIRAHQQFGKDSNRIQTAASAGYDIVERSIKNKLTSYIAIFVFCWAFPLLTRILEAYPGKHFFLVSLLQVLFTPAQGFFNCLVYNGALNVFFRIKAGSKKRHFVVGRASFDRGDGTGFQEDARDVARSPLISAAGGSGALSPDSEAGVGDSCSPESLTPVDYVPKTFSIFITTYNLGEAKLFAIYDNLKDWVVRGHDIYSIGVQECLDLERVREAILTHLGGPDEYKMFCTEIGSDNTNLGYHGFIALTVFVRRADWEAGSVRKTTTATKEKSTGQNLLITTAQNKGAVGIPFQIHDTSVAFLTSHLPSDQKGATKLKNRNDACAAILKEVVLASQDVHFDMHLLHDHVFFTGDLNYRINPALLPPAPAVPPPAESLAVAMLRLNKLIAPLVSVAEAAAAEKAVFAAADNARSWVQEKYSLLLPKSSMRVTSSSLNLSSANAASVATIPPALTPPPVGFPFHLTSTMQNAQAASSLLWNKVLAADELYVLMAAGAVFSGFLEPQVTFPPTYKRYKGVRGDCGDYTEPLEIVKGFSNITGEEEEEASSVGGSSMTHSERLSSSAYSSSSEKHNSARLGASPGRSMSISSVSSSSTAMTQTTNRKGGSTNQRDKKKKSSHRPPSYTDRILVHTLEDRRERCSVQHYDFCDTLRASDHRAVSMVVSLEVNAGVVFPTNWEGGEGGATAVNSVASSGNGGGGAGAAAASSSSPSPSAAAAPKMLNFGISRGENSRKGSGQRVTPPLSEHDEEKVGDHELGADGPDGPDGLARGISDDIFLFELNVTNISVVLLGQEGEDEDGGDIPHRPSMSTKASSSKSKHKHSLSLSSVSQMVASLFRRGKRKEDKEEEEEDDDDRRRLKAVDLRIDTVDVVFPLPSKDPILSQRRLCEMAKAFHLETDELLSSLEVIAQRTSQAYHRTQYTAMLAAAKQQGFHLPVSPTSEGYSLPPLPSIMQLHSKFACASSKTRQGSIRLPNPIHFTDDTHEPRMAGGQEYNSPGSSGIDGPVLKLLPALAALSAPIHAQPCNDLRVVGCVVPQLGAHVLLKFYNNKGDDLGQCCVSLTSLMVPSRQHCKQQIERIPLQSGGQVCGHVSGLFSLCFLATVKEVQA